MRSGIFKTQLRGAAALAVAEHGFEMNQRTGKGIRPHARWMAKPADGPAIEIAVRICPQGSLSSSRRQDGSFRFENVQRLVAVTPSQESPGDFTAFLFKSETLKEWFGKALKAMEDAGRAPELDVPIFIPLHEHSKKNVGHNIVGLKQAALWSARIEAKQLEDQRLSEEPESFIDRVKREFAQRNEVDVGKVQVEFRILT
jgi:hypothetical protein